MALQLLRRASVALSLAIGLGIASGCASAPVQTRLEGPAPATDVDGQPIKLGDGNQMLVFWQPWCKSCKQHSPEVNAAAERHQGKVEFVGISVAKGTAAEAKATAAEWGMTFRTVHDPDLAVARQFGVQGTPTLILFRQGKEVYRGHRLPENLAELVAQWKIDPKDPSSASCEDGVCSLEHR